MRYLLPKISASDRADVCASFQQAVVEVLASKAVRAAVRRRRKLIAVSGGVGLNLRLREALEKEAAGAELAVRWAEPWLCTDNAAMVAYAAAQRWRAGARSSLAQDISPTLGADLFAKS